MNPGPHRLVTGTELRLQRADEHGVRYDDPGKSFDEIGRDDHGASDAYRELLAPDPTGTGSATHRAAANTAHARALLIEEVSGRGGGELDLYVECVQALDPEGRIPPRCSTPEVDGECIANPGRGHQEVMPPQDFPTTGLRL